MSHTIPMATLRELRDVLWRWALLLAACGIFAVWATWRMSATAASLNTTPAASVEAAPPAIEYWTCTMHPHVRATGPGECPQCGMPLIPKYVGRDELGVKPAAPPSVATHAHPTVQGAASSQAWYRCTMPECGDQGSADPNNRCPVCGMKRERVDVGHADVGDAEIKRSERARRLAEIETEAAQPRLLHKHIRSVERVSYDETRYKLVSVWIGGRIDKLFADFTGMTVTRGDHLVEIYSPELLSAQDELLQAVQAASTGGQTDIARRSAGSLPGAHPLRTRAARRDSGP